MKKSSLERRFFSLWQEAAGPELLQEYTFYPGRRWRADFAHLPSKTLIEVEGGVWTHGRHTSPKGFLADAEKYLTAALAGWSVLRLTSPQLTEKTIREIIEYVRYRTTGEHLDGSVEAT